MRQSRQSSSLAVAFATVPRRRAGRDALPASAASDGHWIRLRLAVASAQVFMLRQTLHRAIGQLARVMWWRWIIGTGKPRFMSKWSVPAAMPPCTPS